MGKQSPPDAYPPCFYLPESCPTPCTRPEYAGCPVNPEVRERLKVETSLTPPKEGKLFDPEEIRVNAERIRQQAELFRNPHAREITETLRKAHSQGGGLVCPRCGETDSHGNRMGKVPWCFRCNLPFMSSEKAAKWVKPTPQKRASRGYAEPDAVFRKRG